jgi:P-type conjugative transfer protein TrbJ
VRPLTRRRALLGSVGAALFTVLAAPRAAEADLWGADLGPLTTLVGQMITQIAQYATQIAQFASMISNMVAMVNSMKTALSALSSGDFNALLGFLQTAQMSYGQLTGGVQSMSYKMGAIDSDFQQLYPSSMSSMSYGQRDQVYANWNNELLGAAQIAARQQTILSTLEQQANKADDVVQQSQNASGEVAQMQAIVEMLRLMQTQLVTINQSLATSNRVLADIAASQASNHQLSRAKKQTSLAGYTSRGAPVNVPHRLP